jgi:hypothetical protein
VGGSDSQKTHEWSKVPVGGNSVESNLVKLRDVSSFKEVIVYCGRVEVVENSVHKDKLCPKSCILNLLEEGIIESRDVGTRLVFDCVFTTISISGLMTKHYVELDKVEVVSGGEVVEHHKSSQLVSV